MIYKEILNLLIKLKEIVILFIELIEKLILLIKLKEILILLIGSFGKAIHAWTGCGR